jgi:NAD(P)-dependent dehydrogenase (short-subunit alcohol dehydrogenase family)
MEIDTLGTFAASRAAFPELRKAGGGAVINISATLHYGATWWQARARVLRRPQGLPDRRRPSSACDFIRCYGVSRLTHWQDE